MSKPTVRIVVSDLYLLAGIIKPYNQFELQDLTDKVIADLNLETSDKFDYNICLTEK